MKILELLNKHIIIFCIIFTFSSYNSLAEEPVDIWNIDQKETIVKDNKNNLKFIKPPFNFENLQEVEPKDSPKLGEHTD